MKVVDAVKTLGKLRGAMTPDVARLLALGFAATASGQQTMDSWLESLTDEERAALTAFSQGVAQRSPEVLEER